MGLGQLKKPEAANLPSWFHAYCLAHLELASTWCSAWYCTSCYLLRQAPRPTLQFHPACSAAVASQGAASVADEVLRAGIETSSDACSVSEAQYSDDFESLGRKTPSRTGELLLGFLM